MTGRPASARVRAAVRPEMPAPMIRTEFGARAMGDLDAPGRGGVIIFA